MNQQDLKNILSAKFDFSVWKDLLDKIFPKVELFNKEVQIDASLIKSGGQVGNIRLDDGRSLAIFRFEVADNVQIARNRKSLRDIAAKYVDQGLIHGALVFYYSLNQDDYRLTFISKQTFFNESGELITKETAPKRYTFLLGKNEPCTTAASRLMDLINKKAENESIYLVNVTETFSVERLNKEFFAGYKTQYAKFLKQLSDTKQHRDYVKKLLGRLVFLQFLQKKGWMGVPASNNKWDGGDKNYLSNLVNKYPDNDRLLSDVLEPLFFNTLNEQRSGDIADSKLGEDIKIPYLNGGLFDKDRIDDLDIDFPYSYFKELMEFFSQYNFTIDENDPDDSEVGIDPEMLGHIFENLLEDNKDKGTFYTPKEIVQYMCRQSIIQYLKTHEAEEQYSEPIELLINDGMVSPILQKKDTAIRFTQLLKDVKVCDPAIGSGAFPMGILYVLYHAIHHLHSHAEPHGNFDSTQTKRDIIQNNIFGVDIEQGAVDIARLRFWLALVVDAEEPQPLPNLDYKIVQGNSLLESFMGYDLSNILPTNKDGKISKRATREASKKDMQSVLVFGEEQGSIAEIQRLFRLYFATSNHTQKGILRKNIDDRIKEHIVICSGISPYVIEAVDNIKDDNKPFFLWHLYFADIFQNGGFDIVIANPPYIKEGRMSKTYFDAYKKSPYYKGKMDIWYLFACNGLDLLNDNGVLCFIATNNWTTSFGASKLRDKVIKETRICNIVDFGAVMMFESASIQTMIMMFQKDKTTDDYSFDYRKLTTYKATEKDAIAILNMTSDEAEYFTPTIRRSNFAGKNFTFSQSDNILDKIYNVKSRIFLEEKELTNGIHPHYDFINKKLSEKYGFSIGEGIFGLSRSEIEALKLTESETKFIKPYYNSSDNVARFTIGTTDLSIIYTPSTFKNPHSMDTYPNLKAHLDRFKDVISSDNKPYGLHRARVESFFVGEKIAALRKCAGKPIFAYANGENYMSATFYVIKTDRVNMKYLTGLLNSKLIEFWLKNKGKMQGANYQLDKEPLQQIPIAVPSNDTQVLVATIVDYILFIKSHNTDISSLVSNRLISDYFERIIDGCIYELYFGEHMKEKEIDIIDSALKLINPISQYPSDKEKSAFILETFLNIKKTDNPIRNRLELFTLRSSDILKPIIEG